MPTSSLFRNWQSILLLFALFVTFPGAPWVQAAVPAFEPCSRPEEYSHHARIGNACRLPNGMLRVKLADGTIRETHGLDAPGTLLEPATSQPTDRAALAAATTPFVCATEAHRVVAIYAYPSDGTDHSSTYIPYIRQQFQQANDLVSSTAANFGVSLSLKAACDTDGQLTVKVVQTGFTSSQAEIGLLAQDLGSKGYNVAGQKNWIWFDGNGCGGGVAFGIDDDRPILENQANSVVGYAVVWGQCPFTYSLHEGTHSMGAVTSSAPHSTGAGHCTDDSDVMCYNDGGPNSAQYQSDVCPAAGPDDFYDCNNDDYFNPSPVAGSYLATHWNVGACNNLAIVRSGCGGTLTSTPTQTVGASPTQTVRASPTQTVRASPTQTVRASPTRTLTPTATRTRTSTLTPTRTRTQTVGASRTPTQGTGPTATRTRTPTTGPSPTRTPTPGSNGSACSPVTSTIAAPFTFDGAGNFCWQSSNLGSYTNNWNLASLTINGVNFTGQYVASGSYPAKVNGFWYVSYTGNFVWSHFEAR